MRLGIVIPCCNKEKVIPETSKRISALLDRLVASGKTARDGTTRFFIEETVPPIPEQSAHADSGEAHVRLR